MNKINKGDSFPGPEMKKRPVKNEIQETSLRPTEAKKSIQRVTSSVLAFFQSPPASGAVEERMPSRRASFQAQLKNLINYYPPSEKTIGIWHSFIERIYNDQQIGEDGVVAALEAIVYLRSYKEFEQSKKARDFIKNLSYKIAEEVVQAMRSQKTADLYSLFLEIQQKNVPQEDEIDLNQFIHAVKKMQIDVLNAKELKTYIDDVDQGKWPKKERRMLHLINYSPQQMSKIRLILSKLEKDQRFPALVNRLF